MKKAKNVILFIGDGMGYPTQTAGRILAGGEEYDTAIDKMPWSGSVKTYNIGKIMWRSFKSRIWIPDHTKS